ncbi:MAG TPA: thioredoxin family protein [Thermosynechococcaceae cyanobacterium]
MGEQVSLREVVESSARVLVHFGAPWCGPCRMIEPLLARFQTEQGEPFKLVGINADENLTLSSQYQITTLPTILCFEGGKVVHRLEGVYRRDDLWTALQKLSGAVSPASPVQDT